METESVQVQGHQILVRAHKGRNDKTGLVAFGILGIIFGLLVMSIVSIALYEVFGEGLVGRIVGLIQLPIFLALPILFARWILLRFSNLRETTVTLEADRLVVKRVRLNYEKVKGVNVQALPKFGGLIFWLLSLIIILWDKLIMLVLGWVLPTSMTKTYEGESFTIIASYGKMGLPRALPLGVFYNVDTALQAAHAFNVLIEERQRGPSKEFV